MQRREVPDGAHPSESERWRAESERWRAESRAESERWRSEWRAESQEWRDHFDAVLAKQTRLVLVVLAFTALGVWTIRLAPLIL